MDFFQCLGSLGVSVSALLTTRERGSCCSGAEGERRGERRGREEVEPGEMLDMSSESAILRIRVIKSKPMVIIIIGATHACGLDG